MTWSYSGNPGSSTRDRLRFDLGDVIEADPLLSDEELDFCLERAGSNYNMALADSADAIAQRFAREATMSVAPLSIQYGDRARLYGERAKEYRKRAMAAAVPSTIATSQSRKNDMLSSSDRTGPYFRTGMHDDGTSALSR